MARVGAAMARMATALRRTAAALGRTADLAAGAVALSAGAAVLTAGAGMLLATTAGFAAAPGTAATGLTLAAAALLGWAATPLLRAARTAHLSGPNPDDPAARTPPAGTPPASTVPAGATPVGTSPAGTPPTRAVPAGIPPTSNAPTSTPRASTPPTSRPPARTAPAGAPSARRAPRSHRRPALAGPRRMTVVAGVVVLLGVVCWIRPGEPGRVVAGLLQATVGLVVSVLPLVPLLALVPAGRRDAVPWQALWRDRKALALARAIARRTRDAVLGRSAGPVLATVALFHLLRGQPGLEESAYRQAGGLLGIVTAAPLAGVFSAAGAFGLLLVVLAAVATVTAAHLYRPLGRYPAMAALVLLTVAPVAAGGVVNRVGYRHYLGVDGDRVVVIAGLSPHHRHATYDAAVALAEVSAPVRPLLRKGFPVADRADGTRVAAALADPARTAADGFPDGGLTLRTGECFSFVGGTSNFRYTVPCNGEHTGEVFHVGRLPFTTDPGDDVRTAAARGTCEKAYGGYLGAPYGTSYLPMEPPVVRDDLVACLFAALGPWPLRGTRTVAALQQTLDWSPGPGCTAEPVPPATPGPQNPATPGPPNPATSGPPNPATPGPRTPAATGPPTPPGTAPPAPAGSGLRVTATRPDQVCLSPGRSVDAAGTAPFTVDAEFQPVGRAAGNGRVGVACVGPDAGYHATVGGDGLLTVTKRQGTTTTPLGSAGKARSSPSPQTAVTQIQLTCRPDGAAVLIVATAGAGRELTVTDAQGVTTLGPRLVVEAGGAPLTATVTLFTAKRV